MQTLCNEAKEQTEEALERWVAKVVQVMAPQGAQYTRQEKRGNNAHEEYESERSELHDM